MKKKFLLLLMTSILCLGGGIKSFASSEIKQYNNVLFETDAIPRYKEIISIAYNFHVSDSGKADMSADVKTSTAGKTYVKMVLQQKNGNSWKDIETFSSSEYTKRFLYNETTKVNPEGTYRVYYTINVYIDGILADTVNKYVYQ